MPKKKEKRLDVSKTGKTPPDVSKNSRKTSSSYGTPKKEKKRKEMTPPPSPRPKTKRKKKEQAEE